MSYSEQTKNTPEHKQKMKAKAKATYAKCKAQWRAAGLCPGCGKKPPALDRRLCEDCLESRRLSARKQSLKMRGEKGAEEIREERFRANNLASRRRMVAKARSLGLCTDCRKRPVAPRSKALCEPCLTSRNLATRARVRLIKSNPDYRAIPFDCGICGKRITFSEMKIDHCHERDEIRGYLCNQCNIGIGQFQDSVAILQRAIKYLEDFASGNHRKVDITQEIMEW